jgi:hypothetical protein
MPLFNRKVSHTAFAKSGNLGEFAWNPPVEITELVGYDDCFMNCFHIRQATPYYPTNWAPADRFERYTWVKVAEPGTNRTPAKDNTDISRVVQDFTALPYTGGSNRFVANILWRLGIQLTPEMKAKLGNTPGIGSCTS